MTTTTFTFTFASSFQGWVGHPIGKVVYAHNASTGNPGAGCVSVSLSSKNENPGDTYMDWIGTWEEIGVPSGHTVSEIGSGSLNDYHWRCRQYDTVGSNIHVGPFQFYDTGGNLKGTFSTELAAPAGVTTWTTQNGQAIAVPSSMNGSTQQLALRFTVGTQTGNSNSAVIEFLIDEIKLQITYAEEATATIIPYAEYFYKRRRS